MGGGEQDLGLTGLLVPAPNSLSASTHSASLPAPLVYLGLLESWLKQRSLVLYDLPSLVLSYEKQEEFQPSSSLPPSGKPDFSHHGKHGAEQYYLCNAWISPLQPVCPCLPGTSQWPSKAIRSMGPFVTLSITLS